MEAEPAPGAEPTPPAPARARRAIASWILPLFLAATVGHLGYVIGSQPALRGLLDPGFWRTMGKVGSTLLIVRDSHVEQEAVGWDHLRDGALQGLAGSLDRYSAYLPREAFEEFEEQTRQHYVGLGIEISRLPGRIVVTQVFPGGPASRSDLKVGDHILGVDDHHASTSSLEDVADHLRGPSGTVATLRVLRPPATEAIDIAVTRGEVDVPRVVDLAVDELGIGSLRVTLFGERTAHEFAEALDTLESRGARAVVVDLRGNPGGLLSAAVAMAGEFLPPGTLVVSTEGRRSPARSLRAPADARDRRLPVAVLLNPTSASASEVFAGALRDHGRAVLVGERSTGKGSVQTVFTLKDGDGLRLTTALYRTPSGRSLHEEGLEPDIVVDLSAEEYRNLDLQRSHRGYLGDAAFQAEFGFAPAEDAQLARAREELLRRLAASPHAR